MGVAAKAHERKKLERYCRYIARPAVSEKRLSLLSNGHVRYELKTPYRGGTTKRPFGFAPVGYYHVTVLWISIKKRVHYCSSNSIRLLELAVVTRTAN